MRTAVSFVCIKAVIDRFDDLKQACDVIEYGSEFRHHVCQRVHREMHLNPTIVDYSSLALSHESFLNQFVLFVTLIHEKNQNNAVMREVQRCRR